MSETTGHAPLTLTGGRGLGDNVRGCALVSQHDFGVRYDLDPETGMISNPDHDLFCRSISGQILICPNPKGGVAASWCLADLKDRGIAPLAIVFRYASPIFVQGALFADIAIMHAMPDVPCTMIRDGEDVGLFPREGRIEVYR